MINCENNNRPKFITKPGFWAKHHYYLNCGSFALNVMEWYVPYDNECEDRMGAMVDYIRQGDTADEVYEKIMDADVKFMLWQFSDILVPISYEKMLTLPKETTVIAYRIGIVFDGDWEDVDICDIDEDFHFKVRRNGQWMEKQGHREVRFCELNPDEPWPIRSDRELKYDSEIKYFIYNQENAVNYDDDDEEDEDED